MKKFFQINSDKYEFEMYDITTLLTILNVAFILMGFWWAPILGIINCIIALVLNVINREHINAYVTQIALIILNVYFLTM